MTLPYDQEIKSGSTESVLAGLYRTVLKELGVRMSRFDVLLARFVKRMYANKSSNKDQTSIKSNHYKELMKEKITFKVFVKGLAILNITRFDIMVKLYHANGTVTVHTQPVLVNDHDLKQDIEESEDGGETTGIDSEST